MNHIDGASAKRNVLAKTFSKEINKLVDDLDPVVMFQRMEKHWKTFFDVTGESIA